MSNKVYIATSLDGYITDRNDNLDWLNIVPMNEETTNEFFKFMDSIDALVMGRNTFQKVLSFNQWPYNKKVFVLSNTLQSIPKGYEDKAELINAKPSKIVDDLNIKGYKNLYIDGGKTIQSFLEEDLIDEITITTVPILLGGGCSLFSSLKKHIKFELVETKVLSSVAVQTRYKKSHFH